MPNEQEQNLLPMASWRIVGGHPLEGDVEIGASKNAVLPILFATLLCHSPIILHRIAMGEDVRNAIRILETWHVSIQVQDTPNSFTKTLLIDSTKAIPTAVPTSLLRTIRASYYLLGAGLGITHDVSVCTPGGCDLGKRPIDLHINGLAQMGTSFDMHADIIHAFTTDELCGADIHLSIPSVGATANLILAAVSAKGITHIFNAAKEPHIQDLCRFLQTCGAEIEGIGTSIITICGGKCLHGCEFTPIPDMIEAGTFMAMAVGTNGNLRIHPIVPDHVTCITEPLQHMGATIIITGDSLLISGRPCTPIVLETAPFPGFPTDMQPLLVVLATLTPGESHIIETMWQNRFRYVPELQKMGAGIAIRENVAVVTGGTTPVGTRILATDLRAGASLLCAALGTDGETIIDNVQMIERGYASLPERLQKIGARIEPI